MPVMFDTFSYLVKTYDILPNEWLIAKHTGVALLIDKQSVKHKVPLSITPLTTEEMALLPGNLVNLTSYHNGYRFLPDGQTFERDITIAMVYDTMDIPFGYTPEDIYTFYYNNESMQWEKIERDSVDELNHIVYSRTNHFTDYINGILKTPETSDAMAYTPTSIKDLKAAEPLNGITLMSPPQANNKGTANLSYPITVPQGRRGMQPDLNITYNSSGGSSWLGLGWDLSISSISVETRWGVPYFEQNKESETYLLDGETLVTGSFDSEEKLVLNKPTYRREWDLRSNVINPADSTTQFYTRIEGGFRKIIRHGLTPKDFWWEVIDKNGTRYFYGKKKDIELLSVDKNSVFDNYYGNIAKWYLTEIIDVNGNNVTYDYRTYYSQENNPGKQLYINRINYTGKDNQSGKYDIYFNYQQGRVDITTSGRYGVKETNDALLDNIHVIYNTTDTIKSYYFAYKLGEFKKSLLCKILELDSLERQDDGLVNEIGFNLYERCGAQHVPNTHTFSYDTISNYFGDPVTIQMNHLNNMDWTMYNGKNVDYPSNIGGSSSSSKTNNVGLNFGFGFIPFLKSVTFGGNGGWLKEEGKGNLTLVDINGDGYPDRVYKNKNGKVSYILQKINPLGSNDCFEATEKILNISDFSSSVSGSKPWGMEGHLAANLISNRDETTMGVGANVSWGATNTTVNTFFVDINGDGLVDLVNNGNIYINRLENGLPEFSKETDKDTIFVGGSCGEYVLNNGVVDESIFQPIDTDRKSVV